MKAIKILAEVRELEIMTIAKKPLATDTKGQIQRLHDTYASFIAQSFKIRRIVKPQDMKAESEWLDELHESMSSLPETLWNKDKCDYCSH
jgi:hypothetical protein